MAFEPLPENESTYTPSIEDEMDGAVDTELPEEQVPDSSPGIGDDDEQFISGGDPVESEPGEPEGFEPGGYTPDVDLPDGPMFAEDFPEYIPLEGDPATAEVDDDEGDIFSASTGAPTDEEWDAVEDGDAPVEPAMFALATGGVTDDTLDPGSLTGDDFSIENVSSDELIDPDLAVPVQYEIQGKPPQGEWKTLATVPAEQIDAEVAGLPTEEAWLFRVRAVFSNGEVTDWSAETSVELPKDMLAPPVPSTPVVTAKRGVFTIKWDGKGAGGVEQPSDYKFTIIWQSASGEAGTWNAIGTLSGAGEVLWTGGEYFADMHFSLSSLDNSGNSSARSGVAVAIMKPLVEEPDIRAELDRIGDETGGLVTETRELGNKLDDALSTLGASGERLSDAESRLEDAFGLIGNAADRADAAKTAADAAKAEAASAAGIAEGKGDVLIQPTEPGANMRKASTLWIDTTDAANTPKRWSGTAWVAVTDRAVVDAAKAAASADSKAQKAIQSATDAKERADAALRSSPNLWAWTDDWSVEPGSTFVKTATEISFPGVSVDGVLTRFFTTYIPLPNERTYTVLAWVSNNGDADARVRIGAYLGVGDSYKASVWPSNSYTPIPAGAQNVAVSTAIPVKYADGQNALRAVIYAYDEQPMTIHMVKVVDSTEIISAQETANSALNIAGTKSTVYYDTKGPSGSASRGDVWRKVDGAKNVIAEWFYGVYGWTETKVTSELISNLDVGKLTTGSATIDDAVINKIAAQSAAIQRADIKNLIVSNGTFSEAVIEKLWADVIHARKITAEMLVMGGFDNLIPEPTFTDGGSSWGLKAGVSVHASGSSSGGSTLRISNEASIQDVFSKAYFPVSGGERYLVVAHVRSSVDIPVSGTNIGVQCRNQSTGGFSYPRIENDTAIPANTWSKISGIVEVPVSTNEARFFVSSRAPLTEGVLDFEFVSATRAASAELIVDGTVTTAKLAANSVEAGKIAANAVTADKISAGAVTAVKLAGQSVTADKLAAGAITADKLHADAITGKTITGGVIKGAMIQGGALEVQDTKGKAGVTINGNVFGGIRFPEPGKKYASGSAPASIIGQMFSGALQLSSDLKYETSRQLQSEIQLHPEGTGAPNPFSVFDGVQIRSSLIRLTSNSTASDKPVKLVAAYGSLEVASGEILRLRGHYNDYYPAGPELDLGLDGGGGYVRSTTIYSRTYSNAANLYVTSYGTIGRATSALKYKADVEAVDPDSYEDALLGIQHKSWIDRGEMKAREEFEQWQQEHPFEPLPEGRAELLSSEPKRHYGAIADDFHEAGLTQFVQYDANGEVDALNYDRVGVALLPIVRKQRDKIAAQESRISDLESKLEALMARVDVLEAA
ncbi:hypothetical protein [Glutamicibacter creatinolyticus]|uniref:hypothetical protein n=1 Tax=Glutamicibacter creatinolyticus TaxID=162496 RepID=UPI003217B458